MHHSWRASKDKGSNVDMENGKCGEALRDLVSKGNTLFYGVMLIPVCAAQSSSGAFGST
jgi:hypothetical protein